MEDPECYTRELPVGWPLGEVEYTQCMVWGTPDVLAARMAFAPKTYCEKNGGHIDAPSEAITVEWSTASGDGEWCAFAAEPFEVGAPIGVYAGLLRDDDGIGKYGVEPADQVYSARCQWKGRRLVVDASEYGSLLRFIQLTPDPTKANVKLQFGRCICGKSDPVASLVAVAVRQIAEGAPMLRLASEEECAEATAALKVMARQKAASGIDWQGYRINPDTGTPETGSGRTWSKQPPLYTPIPFIDIKAKRPHALRDSMCMHIPTRRVRIWEVDDEKHVCFGSRALKATEFIKAGEVIGQYTGFVTTASESDGDVRGTYTVELPGREVIDGFVHGNEIRYMNDYRGIAEEKNAEFAGECCMCRMGDGCVTMLVKAVKDIEPDEEILTDYGAGYWALLYQGAEFATFSDGLD